MVHRVCIRRGSGVGGLVFLALLSAYLAPPPANATFHQMSIREVYAGSGSVPGSQYVELQMWSPGQNLVGGHSIAIYDASGALVGKATFAGKVNGAASQSTILVATPTATAEFGVGSDLTLTPGLLDAAGGAVCWESLDCVSWGDFSGSLPSPAGSPASPSGIPDGMALRRTIAPGCPTLLQSGDDSDDSATDFEATAPMPRPNSSAPSERACPSSADGGPGEPSGGSDRGTIQIMLKRTPPRRTRDRTPTFRFDASEAHATFQCKLDRARFRPCGSPFTAKRLSIGVHTFKVRARGDSGELDPSPASFRFRVLAGRRR